MRILLLIVLIFLFSNCDDKTIVKARKGQKNVQESEVKERHTFLVPEVPDHILFADEKIELTDTDVKERFDRELVVNNFWHSNTILYMKRANRWFPMMREILRDNGVPEDFVYLSVIESGLTQATSPSGAKGFWQFLPLTAKEYGLRVNDQVDERKNVKKSTQAACEYLKKAYLEFGSWMLAAASYNRGIRGIHDVLESQKVDSYFDLSLNSETSRYVFRILAVKHIMESPKKFGFLIEQDQLYPEYSCKTIVVKDEIKNLADWAITHNTSLKVILRLNPWILSDELYANEHNTFELLIPKNSEQLGLYKG